MLLDPSSMQGFWPTLIFQNLFTHVYNEWIKEPSRTSGQNFEWDVQLSFHGKKQLGWATRDESHLNVSLDGRITHR